MYQAQEPTSWLTLLNRSLNQISAELLVSTRALSSLTLELRANTLASASSMRTTSRVGRVIVTFA